MTSIGGVLYVVKRSLQTEEITSEVSPSRRNIPTGRPVSCLGQDLIAVFSDQDRVFALGSRNGGIPRKSLRQKDFRRIPGGGANLASHVSGRTSLMMMAPLIWIANVRVRFLAQGEHGAEGPARARGRDHFGIHLTNRPMPGGQLRLDRTE